MPKTSLEKQISELTGSFAQEVVKAIKSATLQELMGLQGADASSKPGQKPGRKKPGPKPGSKRLKPGPKPGRKKPGRKKPGPKPGSKRLKPGPKPKAKEAVEAPAKKKRVVKNYPKCAYPRCRSNRFVRGKGFCGKHFKAFVAGEIKAAAEYKKK